MKQVYHMILTGLKYLVVTVLLISISGCSSDKREDNVSAVLKQIYQAPDLALIDLSDKMTDDLRLLEDELTNKLAELVTP